MIYVKRTFRISLAACLLAWIPSGCAPSGGQAPNSGTTAGALVANTGSPLNAFQNSVYNAATAANSCVQCHQTGGIGPGGFAGPSMASSCASLVASGFVNFSNPAASPLAVYSGNNHCGVSACAGSGNPAQYATFIQNWATATAALGAGASPCSNSSPASAAGSGGSGGSGGGAGSNLVCPVGTVPPSSSIAWTTAPQPIPNITTLPSGSTKTGAIVRWNLSDISPALPLVAGGVLEAQVQADNATVYNVILPKMLIPTTDTAVNVTGLHVLVQLASQPAGSGCEAPDGDDWIGTTGILDALISPSAIPNPLPATPLTATAMSKKSVLVPMLSSADAFSIGFESITASTAH